MPQHKFAVGDKVRIIEANGGDSAKFIGRIGVVVDLFCDRDNDCVYVDVPAGDNDCGEKRRMYLDRRLQKYEEGTTVQSTVKRISVDGNKRNLKIVGETANAINLDQAIERLQHLSATLKAKGIDTHDARAYFGKVGECEGGLPGNVILNLWTSEVRDNNGFEILHGIPTETPAQAKVRELEATIAAARAQIQELQREA